MQCSAYKDGRCAVQDIVKVDCEGLKEKCRVAEKLIAEMELFSNIWDMSVAKVESMGFLMLTRGDESGGSAYKVK